MSFPICDYEFLVCLVGHEEAFETFQPRIDNVSVTVSFKDINLSTPVGRIRALFFMRRYMPSECFMHLFGYLLFFLNVGVHPITGKLVSRSGLIAFEHLVSMFSYVNNPLISDSDQDILIDKLIQNRAMLADGCCRKCGTTRLYIEIQKRICYHMRFRVCTQRGKPNHMHFGRAKVAARFSEIMRRICYSCAKLGYNVDDNDFLCDGENRVLSTIVLSETL